MKKVLFVCVENSCRSQMAEWLAKYFGKGVLKAYSAGSKPSGTVNPSAISVMKEIGIDMSGALSKGFSGLEEKEFDFIIGMGCNDVCPFVPGKEHRRWEIDDPKGKGMDFFRLTRDKIKVLVLALIEEFKNNGEE